MLPTLLSAVVVFMERLLAMEMIWFGFARRKKAGLILDDKEGNESADDKQGE